MTDVGLLRTPAAAGPVGSPRSITTAQNGARSGPMPSPKPADPPLIDREMLRREIQEHLESIGLNDVQPDGSLQKESIRLIHRVHRQAAQRRILRALGTKLDSLLGEIADGDEVDPRCVQPELVEAVSQRRTGDLFRFASLAWSIPVSQGYGRRMRYLVRDRANGKLIGIFALGDPVFNLRVRDDWIGWHQADRRDRLVNLMDAYVVGAVPPYSGLLGGKLVASLIASHEVVSKFEERYGETTGLISKKNKRARLALVTVTSALGRSSMYNRLKLLASTQGSEARPAVEYLRLGETTGYGHFQITDDLFARLRSVLEEDGHVYANGHQFGDGPNWRIRVARKGLETLDMDADAVLKHGIKREVYALQIANNCREFLLGQEREPEIDCLTVDEIAALARERWILPRSMRMPQYRQFRRQQLHSTIEQLMENR